MSTEERKRLYHTELIKAGIDFHQAEKVSKLLAENSLLAENLLDEQLTPEENQLVQDVCTRWLAQRKRMNFISKTLSSSL
ncbi:MAG TPA: hypothetical protein V6C78_28280 [Crinalium sp.]|jgi:hypothetical protein